jgi:hypothetical protein
METNGHICLDAPPGAVYAPHPAPPCRHCGEPGATPHGSRRRGTLFWGLSGGTLLSAVGFVALTLYQQYHESLTELRNDLKHFHLTAAEQVRKEELQGRLTAVWGGIRGLQAAQTACAARDARVAHLEQQLHSGEEDRKHLAREVQRLRERLAAVEGRQAATPTVLPASHVGP